MVRDIPSNPSLAIELMRSLARQHFDEFVRFLEPDYHMGWFHLRLAKPSTGSSKTRSPAEVHA